MARIPLDPTGNADIGQQLYDINQMLIELYSLVSSSSDPTYSVNVANVSFVAQVADVLGSGVGQHILSLPGQTKSASVVTLPSVAAVVAAINAVSPATIGQSWTLRVLNSGPQTWTVVAASNDWSIPQPLSITSGAFLDVLFIITSVTPGAVSGV